MSPLLDATGLYDRRIDHASSFNGSWTIVMYHRVIEDAARDPFRLGMCVMVDRFEQQIRYLCQQFNIISMSSAMQRLRAGEALPQRALSVTFDDGYLDNLTRAMPILQRYQVPFSVYVPTGDIEEGRMLWWDRAIAALAGTRRTELDLQEVGLSQESVVRSLQGVSAAANAEDILERLWAMQPAAAEACVKRLERWLSPVKLDVLEAQRLSVAQLQEMHRQGVEIGAHSISHANLAFCDDATVHAEVSLCREKLEGWLQTPVLGFAYPGGRLDERTQAAVQLAGYAYGLSTDTGLNRPPHVPHRLLRIGMPDAELPDFRRSVGAALMRGQAEGHVRF